MPKPSSAPNRQNCPPEASGALLGVLDTAGYLSIEIALSEALTALHFHRSPKILRPECRPARRVSSGGAAC